MDCSLAQAMFRKEGTIEFGVLQRIQKRNAAWLVDGSV